MSPKKTATPRNSARPKASVVNAALETKMEDTAAHAMAAQIMIGPFQ
jgi:hypothetical protein